ncbi:MAG: 2-phospho-L-lactate transferase [Anaerolineales bacterium]
MALRVVALAGGVGGAKLADGLARTLPPENLSVVVNTGDDFSHLDLRISPDLDTVVYTLAGLADRQRGWGRADESWDALETLDQLGGPVWFQLGDKDLGLHLFRTQALASGESLSQVTDRVLEAMDVPARIFPMTDDPVSTMVETDEGALSFQDYFVRRHFEPEVRGFTFVGAEVSQPAPGVLKAIADADVVIFCPSNPWVSIDPILSVPGLRSALSPKTVIAVSPIIGGLALKGPAAKMCHELGLEPSATTVAKHYGSLLTGFVLDVQDSNQKEDVAALGLDVQALQTVMKSTDDRVQLAEQVLAFAEGLALGVRP